MRGALVIDFGSAPLEGGSKVEDKGNLCVATSVEVTPTPVILDGGKAFGELVGVLEADGDNDSTFAIDETEVAVFLDECEAVAEDVFGAFGGGVFVFERKDDAASCVDDAVAVANAHFSTGIKEGADFVVDAWNDFASARVDKAVFTVSTDGDTTVREARVPNVDGGSEGVHGGVEEGHTFVGSCKKEGIGEKCSHFGVEGGEDDAATTVDKSPKAVLADEGVSAGEGLEVFVAWGEELFTFFVNEGAGGSVTVNGEQDGRKAFGEAAGLEVLEGDDEVAEEVAETEEAVAIDKHTVLGGEFDGFVEAGDDLVPVAVDDAAAVFFKVDFAVAVEELTYIEVDIGCDDSAVVATESVAVAVAGGFNTVDVEDVTATLIIIVVSCFLSAEGEGEEEGEEN